MEKKPHILVTNDDSIQSGFLKVLVEGLKTAFTVTVAAPKREQSWIGRAISRNRDVSVETQDGFGCTAYSIDGTPSDCVNIALSHILESPPDAVCSGINVGYNATLPFILSSGTISGAIEGAVWGIPSIAFSYHIANSAAYEIMRQNNATPTEEMLDPLKNASLLSVKLTQEILGQDMTEPIVHNVNFPAQTTLETPIEETEPAPVKMSPLFTLKNTEENGKQIFTFKYSDKKPIADGPYDYLCLQNKKISRSVLNIANIGKLTPGQ